LRHDSRPLQKEKDEVKKTVPEMTFHGSKNSCKPKILSLKLLKLKANEIELFLQFCEADPKSKQLQQTTIR
jgi:hypothetical protein